MVSDLGCSTRNTSVNFDPGNLENFQAPSVDPLPRSDMNLSQSLYHTLDSAQLAAGVLCGSIDGSVQSLSVVLVRVLFSKSAYMSGS